MWYEELMLVFIGGRTADAIVDTALSKLKSLVQDRLRGKGGSSGRSGGGKVCCNLFYPISLQQGFIKFVFMAI